MYMSHLFIGTLLGREVLYLKVLGLRLLDHVVVVLDGVRVMVNMTLSLVLMLFSPTVSADHIFPLVVIAFLQWDRVCMVCFLTLF